MMEEKDVAAAAELIHQVRMCKVDMRLELPENCTVKVSLWCPETSAFAPVKLCAADLAPAVAAMKKRREGELAEARRKATEIGLRLES